MLATRLRGLSHLLRDNSRAGPRRQRPPQPSSRCACPLPGPACFCREWPCPNPASGPRTSTCAPPARPFAALRGPARPGDGSHAQTGAPAPPKPAFAAPSRPFARMRGQTPSSEGARTWNSRRRPRGAAVRSAAHLFAALRTPARDPGCSRSGRNRRERARITTPIPRRGTNRTARTTQRHELTAPNQAGVRRSMFRPHRCIH